MSDRDRDTWLARDRVSLGDPGKLRFHPMVALRGEGSHLIEPGGRRVLDFSAGWGAASLGYAHHAVVDAVSHSVRTMAGVGSLSLVSPPAVLLAEALLDSLTDGVDRQVWFGHSGTDACDMALRLVTNGPRKGVFSFKGSYHGGFGGGMAISGHAALAGSGTHADLVQLDYPRDQAGAATVLDQVDGVLAGGSFAALFVEPILSDGGLIVPPDGFLAGVAERCRRHGTLLVADEVKVGMGRTGKKYAHQWDEIAPDLLVLGKGLGGGLPISAVIAPTALMESMPSGAMLTTQGNPIAASAALAVVTAIRSDEVEQHVERIGAVLRRRLDEMAGRCPLVREVRGRGLVLGIELGGSSTHTSADYARLVSYRAWELGLLFYYVGGENKVLELTPPLVLSEGEAERGVSLLEQAIVDAEAGRVDVSAAAAWAGW
ncbi:MAG: class-III pyridoxal-phosphate-dependent aminotransferase [Gemmatimonadales bacterium]